MLKLLSKFLCLLGDPLNVLLQVIIVSLQHLILSGRQKLTLGCRWIGRIIGGAVLLAVAQGRFLKARADVSVIICAFSVGEASLLWAQDLAGLVCLGDLGAAFFSHVSVDSVLVPFWRFILALLGLDDCLFEGVCILVWMALSRGVFEGASFLIIGATTWLTGHASFLPQIILLFLLRSL